MIFLNSITFVMDAIKKKLVALREETDRAVAKANAAEDAANAANQRAEETEEKQRKLQKKLSEKENRLEVMLEDLTMAEIRAEEKEKLFHVAEQDIKQSERTIILKEAEVERAEDNLCSNTTNMSYISKKADDAEKIRKELERALMAREDTIEQLENKHKVQLFN